MGTRAPAAFLEQTEGTREGKFALSDSLISLRRRSVKFASGWTIWI